MKYKLGQSYLLPVKEVINENKRVFYKVEANGKEYNILLFDFQKEDEKPDNIACIVKEIREGEPLFVQDTQPLLLKLYKENESYPFWVKKDCSYLPNPYYEISDWNNFTFKLPAIGLEKLNLRQRVECRVKSVLGGKIQLELIQKKDRTYSLPFIGLDEILDQVDTSVKVKGCLNKIFQKHKWFKESKGAYNDENEEWIMMSVSVLDKNMDQWVASRKCRHWYLLDIFKRVCIYLLEDSDILLRCSENERERHQTMLSQAAQHADVYQEAIEMVRRNIHVSQTDIILAKMKKSEFLYEPDRRLKVLMCLFSLDRSLMESKMLLIFDIIIKGKKENWMREPFRSAFIEMLDLFIRQNRNKIDRLAVIASDEDAQNLKNLIVALAIQLLLMNEKDNLDRQLSRAMFYRYLTYVGGSKSEVLLEKAFRCLTEVEQGKLDFKWNEVLDLTMLAIRTSSILPPSSDKSTFMQSYSGKYSKLQILDGKIELYALNRKGKQVAALPDNMLPWHNIQVYLNGTVEAIGSKKVELLAYQRFWTDIENAVVNNATDVLVSKLDKKKIKPEVGDEVTIRVKSQDFEDPSHFVFEIEDPAYYGVGRLAIRNIVKYNALVDESAFCDNDGRPYLLKAKVLSTDGEGNLNFVITDLMNDFVRECISVGDETVCLVTDIIPNGCLCVSENGYSMCVPIEEEELVPGQYIKAEIANVRSNGTVEGTFLFKTNGNFVVKDVFEDLILSYADEKVYENETVEKEVEQQQEVMMEFDYVMELINILDRKAVLEVDYITAYNYLAFVRVLTLLIKDSENTRYYTERMRLIQMLQYFAINGSVERIKLDELTNNYSMMINNYPMLQSKLHELQMVACMDMPEKNDTVWKLMSETSDEHLYNLCCLVLSYNSLKGFGLYRERESIKKKINEVLNIRIDREEPEYFGEENQHREFKTSTVYPSNNSMRPDLNLQTVDIMKVICGFLNAEGGILYLGVNNEGVAAGLESDLHFFGSKDRLDLHIRNNIAQRLGIDANSRIKVSTSEKNDRYVYAIQIEPSIKPVELDGVVYQRQGTSTWPLLGDDLEMFKRRRVEELAKYLDGNTSPLEMGVENPESLPAIEPEVVKELVKEGFEVSAERTSIATSVIRENPVKDWEENYGVDTVCYLHLLPGNEYTVTYDEYWDDVELSLCIKNGDDFLVIGYETGKIIKVPVSQIVDKKERAKYKRNTEKVIFACPVRKGDLLYTEVKGNNGEIFMRLDDVSVLKEGKILDCGEKIVSVELDSLVRCEVLLPVHKEALRKIYNLKPTQLGHQVNNPWCLSEAQYVQELLKK